MKLTSATKFGSVRALANRHLLPEFGKPWSEVLRCHSALNISSSKFANSPRLEPCKMKSKSNRKTVAAFFGPEVEMLPFLRMCYERMIKTQENVALSVKNMTASHTFHLVYFLILYGVQELSSC